MRNQRLFSSRGAAIGTALLLSAQATAAAQGQPVTADDRDVGLALRELVVGQTTSLGGAPVFTVSGEPGAVYEIFGGVAAQTNPFNPPTLVGGVAGPVHAPVIGLSPAGLAPRTGTVGVIPPGGVQEIDFGPGAAVPAFLAGLTLEFQVLHQDASGALQVSNSQRRRVIAGAPPLLQWLPTAALPTSAGPEWADIEQGDVDGDGDLDVMAAGVSGTQLWLNTGAGYALPMIGIPGVTSATSLEFADFDSDGFLDVAIASVGGNFINVFRNDGIDAAGVWQGFTALTPLALGFPWPLGPGSPSDLEVGDLNGDGLRDIFLACAGNPVNGQPNRMFFQTTLPGGRLSFAEVPVLPGDQLISDDSEDCELFDFDLDGDLDVVIANVDGSFNAATNPFGEGVDYILVNQGGAQGGLEGTFIAPIPNPIPPADDESLDVVVGDLDGDGAMDIYFSNWAETRTPGVFTIPATPVPDRLLMSVIGPGGVGYVDMSALLPDQGPNDATFSTDAEIVDVAADGTLDIVKGLGTLGSASTAGVPATPLVGNGVQVLFNQGGAPGALMPFAGPIPIVGTEAYDIRDLEHGDWRTAASAGGPDLYFELDLGVARTGVGAEISTLEHQ